MELRIDFRSKIYIQGNSIEEIKQKYYDLPIFTADALDCGAEIEETEHIVRVDDDSYTEIENEWSELI